MMLYPEGRILVFCKAPEPGKVKTRLQGALSPAQCAQLHARLTRHTLQTSIDSKVAEVELWCADDAGHPFFSECARRYGVRLNTQRGEDLGARMAHALRDALNSSTFAIIIGTDCPGLGAAQLQTAAGILAGSDRETGIARVIIGPATDGGYVLIGMDRPLDGAFENIDWGGNQVLEQTRARLRALHATYSELETLPDIDRPGDWQYLPASLASGLPFPGPADL